MNLKKILFTCLILMILSVTAVSATDSDNINATDSIEPAQAIEPVKTVEHNNTLEPVSKNKSADLSKIQSTSTSPGTFDDLQLEINNAKDGSVLVLTRDYNGQYGSRIHLDKDITIDGQGHTLNCLGEKGCFAFFSTTGIIILKNIRIINGHNDYNDKGGAIRIEESAKYTLENCTFENNWADNYGGAIYNNGQTLTIKNCTFNGNTADDKSGGAIYSTYDIIIESSTFTNNKADESGGAIFTQNCEFYLKGCIFKSNNADRFGGAICHNNEININNCTFENNHAKYQGGAIRCRSININTDQSKNESFNTYFIGNTVSNSFWDSNCGGAILAFYGGKIVNAYFKDNQALIDGGAIYVTRGNSIYIDHCLFESNTANGPSVARCYGGAIYSGDVYIHNSTFKDNSAYDYGGAIYAMNVRINHDREGETADTFFINNKVKDNNGGAIYATDDVYVRNTEFTGNTAYVDGGAIYAENNVEVIRSIFESNRATGASSARCYGGAIRAEENAKINNCTFKNNHADNRGGAVYASTVTLEGDKNTFEGNSAKDYGGAIYTDTFTNDVSHVSFINNKVEGEGGAVYINKENWITFTDCIFMDNRASNKGGAIYLDSKNSHLTIRNNVFINNIAYNGGHTVFNYGYYDAISDNFWSILPTDYNNQLVEWKAVSSNVQHTDSNPVTFTIEIIGSCCANLTSGVKISFAHKDGTTATLPMIAEYFSMSGVEGIEIEGKKVSSDSITILFTPTEAGTYELPAYIAGMTGIITINVIDGGAIIPPLPVPINPNIPKPVIPTAKTNC